MRRLLISLTACGLLCVFACSDLLLDSANTLQSQDFPHRVGARWVYAVTDSVFEFDDTVRVTVSDTCSMLIDSVPVPATRWMYTWDGRDCRVFADCGESRYVMTGRDSILMAYCPEDRCVYDKLIVPLREGNSWSLYGASDTTLVIGRESVTVPAGTFANAWRVHSVTYGIDDVWIQDRWYVHRVGLVKQHSRAGGMFRLNEVWELMSYEIQ